MDPVRFHGVVHGPRYMFCIHARPMGGMEYTKVAFVSIRVGFRRVSPFALVHGQADDETRK